MTTTRKTETEFDREAWKREREEEAEDLKAQIKAGVLAARDSNEYRRLLDVAARFHNYSLYNTMLILIQRPDATRVAGFWDWKKKHERSVRKGEHGIRILAPVFAKAEDGEEDETKLLFFKTVSVFDISQTDGEPLPEESILLKGMDATLYKRLLQVAHREGLTVDQNPERTSANGFYHRAAKRIWLSPKLEPVMAAKTLAHELGHHFAEHELNGHCREEAELIAESVAYVVLKANGIDSAKYTFTYLASWSQSDEDLKQLQAVMTQVMNIRRKLLTALDAIPPEPLPPAAEVIAAVEEILTPPNPPGWDVVDTEPEPAPKARKARKAPTPQIDNATTAATLGTTPMGAKPVTPVTPTTDDDYEATIMGVKFKGTPAAGSRTAFDEARVKAVQLITKEPGVSYKGRTRDGSKVGTFTMTARQSREIARHQPPPLPKRDRFTSKLIAMCTSCNQRHTPMCLSAREREVLA